MNELPQPTANIKNNSEIINTFFPRLETRQGCLLWPLLLNIVSGVLASAIMQRREIKSIHFGKKEIKLSLFTDNTILYVGNPKESTKKWL